MKVAFLWIASAIAVCLVGGMLHFRSVRRRRKNVITLTTILPDQEAQRKEQDAPASIEETPDQEAQQQENVCEEDPAEKQKRLKQLREQLCQQRAEICRMEHRQDCAVLMEGLSSGIQELLALENRPCPQEANFCRQLVIAMENESMRFRMDHRKAPTVPKPLSPEEEAADEEALRNTILMERILHPVPALDLPWDALIDELLPCLSKLMLAAGENRAEDCRKLLAEQRSILSAYGIEPIWYRDEVIQSHPDMQWDYVHSGPYPAPTLYYHTGDRYFRIGTPGRADENGTTD